VPQEAQKNITFLVTLGTETDPADRAYEVTAAYPQVNEQQFPGFVQLRDEKGVVAALVPVAASPFIRRADADLSRVPVKAPAPVPKPPALPRATDAQLAKLAAHGSKPGDV
jgi:hypothetical protein